MASITSLGTGSGLDLEGLVTKLMTAERVPITTIQTKEAKEQTKLSAWGQIKSALSTLQAAAQAMDTSTELVTYSGSIADSTVASVAVGSSASAGKYSLEVTQLATAQKTRSSGYASATAALATSGATSLTLKVGSTEKTLSLSANSTLQDLRDAINDANAGVTASIVNDGKGTSTSYSLVLTGDETGTANAFSLTGLTGTDTLSTVTAAANAEFTIDGIDYTRSSNTVADAINGVTLTLQKTNVDDPTTLNVTTDTSALKSKVSTFVTAYNTVNTLVKSLTAYNADTKTAAMLNGDSTLSSVQSQLKSIISSAVGSGSVSRLAEIGVAFQKDGSLKLDSTTFDKALSSSVSTVASLFIKDTSTGVTGIASQLGTKITAMLNTDGVVTDHTEAIQKKIDDMDDRTTVLEDRMTAIEKRYRTQFSALDTLVANLNTSASYLTQMLKSLDSSNS